MEKDVRAKEKGERRGRNISHDHANTFRVTYFVFSKESEEEEYDASEYPQRVGRQKHILDIDIQFNDNRRPGGGRGRGQRSGPRGNRTNQRGGGTRDAGERPERRYRGDEQVI